MNHAAKTLLERIRREGRINGETVKVDLFLNHMVDPQLIDLLATDIASRYAGQEFDKILTAETSGIMLAQAVAGILGIPFVFAKKKRPLTMAECYSATSYSYTKQEATTLHVSREVLKARERVLFVDDFFARGATWEAITEIVSQARAILVGTVVIINKSARRDIDCILNFEELHCSDSASHDSAG